MRKILLTSLLSLSCLNFIGCKQDTSEKNIQSEKMQDKKNVNGKDIYRSVVFGYGKTADEMNMKKNINQLDISKENKDEMISFFEKIISGIENNDRNFFNKISEAIAKRDIYELDNLISGSEPIIKTLSDDLSKSLNSQSEGRRITVCGPNVCGAGVYFVAYVANTLAVTHFAAVALASWKYVGANERSNSNYLDYQEQLRNIIEYYAK